VVKVGWKNGKALGSEQDSVLVSGVLESCRRGNGAKAREMNFEFGQQHCDQISHCAGDGSVLAEELKLI
jgi:hypothetical protein